MFKVNLAIQDTDPDPNRGEYVGAPSGITFQFGSYVATSEGGGSGDAVAVRNFLNFDDYRMNAVLVSGAAVNGFVPTNLMIVLIDDSASVFVDDTLPVDLDLADFSQALATIIFQQPGLPSPNVQATIASLTVTDLTDPDDILNDYDTWVDEGSLVEAIPNGLKTLRRMLNTALKTRNCHLLVQVLRRVDGNPRPPDFVAGDSAAALAALIEGLLELYGCQ